MTFCYHLAFGPIAEYSCFCSVFNASFIQIFKEKWAFYKFSKHTGSLHSSLCISQYLLAPQASAHCCLGRGLKVFRNPSWSLPNKHCSCSIFSQEPITSLLSSWFMEIASTLWVCCWQSWLTFYSKDSSSYSYSMASSMESIMKSYSQSTKSSKSLGSSQFRW